MIELVNKYAAKITRAGLAENPLVCGFDDIVVWNRKDPSQATLKLVMDAMNINALICAEPAEPYRTILLFLCARYPERITPRDCETRTFLHDLPVSSSFTAEPIIERLKQRKSVIIADRDRVLVLTTGTVGPEQAFVTFSSVCFSTFVLFFSGYLSMLREGTPDPLYRKSFARAVSHLEGSAQAPPQLLTGPFASGPQVVEAIIEAGRHTVEYRLVDSYFGNISYLLDNVIYISQTGSSLDELGGCIDPCPMDGSSCTGITASSELSAHSDIFLRTANRAILHGHPKFAVILSMDCDLRDCPNRDQCHIKCSRERFIADIPIVPGEVGTGPTGLCNTLPPAITGRRGTLVLGHGLFTVGTTDFNEPFKNLLAIEQLCREEYFRRVRLFAEQTQ